MNDNQNIRLLADNMASYMWERHFLPRLADVVHFYRATVVAAAAGGKITVQKPFDTQTVALPFAASAAGLTAGQQCLVLSFGNPSNSIIIGNGTLSNL